MGPDLLPCPTCGKPMDVAGLCAGCGRPPLVCGDYRVTGVLGRGGMSVVYAARASDGQEVAVKVLALGQAADWKGYELFERSTAVLRQLEHPALPRLLAFEKIAGRLLLVRERFDGGSLKERVFDDGRRRSADELRGVARELLELLAYLHSRVPPVLHRDIKPANIMFRTPGDWHPVLVDFDTVAAPGAQDDRLTLVVSPGYTAPEQLVGDVSPASDLYSLGATLLALATHTHPDRLPRSRGRVPPDCLPAALDPALRALILRLVEPDRQDRYASAEAALADLDAPAPAPSERPAVQPPPGPPWISWAGPLALASLVIFIVVLMVAVGSSHDPGYAVPTPADAAVPRPPPIELAARPIWRFKTDGKLLGVQVGGNLVVAKDGQDTLYGIDAVSGKQRWRKLMPARPSRSFSIQIANGRVFYNDGTLSWLAADTGDYQRELSLPVRDFLYVDGQLFVTAAFAPEVQRLDPATGAVLWTATLRGAYPLGLVAAPGVVISTTDIGFVHAFDAETGNERWRINTGTPAYARGVAGGTLALVVTDASNSGAIRGVDLASGRETWQSPGAGGAIPDMADGKLVWFDYPSRKLQVLEVASGSRRSLAVTGDEPWNTWRTSLGLGLFANSLGNGQIVLIDIASGRCVHVFVGGPSIEQGVVLAGGTLYYGSSEDSSILAFDLTPALDRLRPAGE